MIRIPENIKKIANYKPGKPGADMFDGKKIERTAILCSNENNFGSSPLAKKAIEDALNHMYLYPDPTGDALKEKLATKYDYNKDQIILGNGSDGILYSLFKAFFEGNDHILTSDATFVSLHAMAQMNNVPFRTIPMKEGYAFDLDAILQAINEDTKAIYICNPNNPTGAMIAHKDLLNFIIQIPNDRLIIIDEAYFEFSRDLSDVYPDSTRFGFENVLTLRTFSKAYGLAGIRLGYGIAHPTLIQTLQKVKLTFNPNILAQAAGTAALDDDSFLQLTLSNNREELLKLYQFFHGLEIEYIPSFANFVMIDLKKAELVEETYEALRQNGVLTRRLGSFGLPHCLRVSVGRPEENEWFMTCFKEVQEAILTEV